MKTLVRKSWRWFMPLTAAAFALRLWFIFRLPTIAGDSFFYGALAKNWLQHGIVGITEAAGVRPSLIRLPGYPGFIAAIWAVTGTDHYRAVLLAQMFVDVAACFVIADLARRSLVSSQAGKIAFLLAALCPFTANYVACALAETLAIFFTVLALDWGVMALESGRLWQFALCGAAIGAAILMRPDDGLLLPAIAGCCLVLYARRRNRPTSPNSAFDAAASVWLTRAATLTLVAVAPLVPWTIRNWVDFHRFQPLAPRYANDPEQFVSPGFQRWTKTWMAEYVSVSEVYWALDESPLEIDKLPRRAFDTLEEYQRTQAAFAAHNIELTMTPAIDRQFSKLAQERIQRHPLRYYVWLPALRVADMWLRPRTEMLGVEDHWWQRWRGAYDWNINLAFGLLNLLYIGLAASAFVIALRRSGRFHRNPGAAVRVLPRYWGILLAFVVIRSLFLGSLENPETRYTLECYPVLMVLGAATLARTRPSSQESQRAETPPESERVACARPS